MYPQTFFLTIFHCIFLIAISALLLVVALRTRKGPYPVPKQY